MTKDNLLTNLKYRESILKYAKRFNVTRASLNFNVSRTFIYKLLKRYDGTKESLKPLSRRPHKHPNTSTDSEYKLIKDYMRRNHKIGLIILWVKLRDAGYSRSITTLYRSLIRLGLKTNPPKPEKRKRNLYDPTSFPGERIQIDVKRVPQSSVNDGTDDKYYQYTAIDEYSRFRYLEVFKEQSTYSSSEFIKHCVKRMPFKILCVQTDNGFEFTSKFISKENKPTLFQMTLNELGIVHRLIKPYTPRHNGKVERSHRKDKMYFYHERKFMSFTDLKEQLSRYLRAYNDFPMQPLKFRSPNQVLEDFKDIKT